MIRSHRSPMMLLAAPGIALLLTLVAMPLVLLLWSSWALETDEVGVATDLGAPLLNSIGWSLGIASACALVGWPVGRIICTSGPALKSFVLACSLMPAYGLFYCWWSLLRPGNPLADAAMAHGWTVELRQLVLAVSLVAWGWPLAAWVVCVNQTYQHRLIASMLALDGGSWLDRLRARWREDRGSLGVATAIIALAIMGETTAFDAAQVPTFASEVRALDAVGASSGEVVRTSLGGIAVSLAAAVCVAMMLGRMCASRGWTSSGDLLGGSSELSAGGSKRGWLAVAALGICATVLPIALLAWEVREQGAFSSFFAIHARGATNALAMAAVSGAIGGVIAVSAAAIAIARWRWLALGALSVSLAALALPATIVALAHAQAWRAIGQMGWLYDSVWIIALAQAARFSVVALAGGFWCASSLSKSDREAWLIHGRGLMDFIAMSRQSLWSAFLCGSLMVGALCVAETSLAARLAPPGIEWISSSLLNAIHYQDPASVSAALPWMAALGGLCACVIGWLGPMWRGASLMRLLFLSCAILTVSCDAGNSAPEGESSESLVTALPTPRVIGRTGFTEGRFQMPRALAVEPSDTGAVFVVDKSARVQRFDRSGKFERGWKMPRSERGKPTGLTIGPDGLLYVADTHEHCVTVFNRDGALVKTIGAYGTGPGEFIYPCDIAFDAAGRMFVAEYGGNDRIQVFASDGKWSHAFGSPGQQAGQFARPQSIVISPADELFAVDSCNHRIQVFSLEGKLLRVIGSAGSAGGEFAYPYSVALANDGSLLVAEFGNCRIQRIDSSTGKSLGIWGGGGTDVGRLNAPWAIEIVHGSLYIVDAGNGRVQVVAEKSLR